MLYGVDVSEWQNGLWLKRVRDAGATFAIVRTGDGLHDDLIFNSHVEDARRSGLITAAYHYLRSPRSVSIPAQADLVARKLRTVGLSTPFFIDVEDVDNPLSIGDVFFFRNELRNRGVNVVGAYSGYWYWGERMGNPGFGDLGAVWHSHYGNNTNPAFNIGAGDGRFNTGFGGRNADILQYSSVGRFPGYGGNVDLNAYRGSVDDLKRLLHI